MAQCSGYRQEALGTKKWTPALHFTNGRTKYVKKKEAAVLLMLVLFNQSRHKKLTSKFFSVVNFISKWQEITFPFSSFLLQKRFTFSQETIRIICHYSVTIIVRQDRWWTGFFSPSFLCTAIIAACFEISNTRSQHWWQLTSASASIW